jgi:hypothetical protein
MEQPMSRLKLLFLWLLCTLASPILSIAMLCQAAFGSTDRALSMAVAQDECGNALFGGARGETISTRTGNALIQGKRWAKIVAPIIDFLMGQPGHCLANATLPH